MKVPAVYPKLKEIREAKVVTLRENKYLREDTELRHYQAQMVMHLLMLNKMVVGDDVGLGKTIEIIATYCYLLEKDPDLKVIWLGPKNSLYQVASEFERFTKGISSYVVRGIRKEDRIVCCKTGLMKKYLKNSTYCGVCEHAAECEKLKASFRNMKNADFRKMKYKEFGESDTNILILNYSLALIDHKQILEHVKNFIVIFDEAAAFKNHKSKTWAVCHEIAEASTKAWAATATIIKNRLEEAFSIFKCILPGLLGNVTSFRNNFCIQKHIRIPGSRRRIPITVGYKNLKAFRELIDPYFLGRTAKQVDLELPTLISKEIRCEMSPIQKEKYAEALDGLLETDEGQVKTVTKLTAITYCQQIANSPYLVGVEGASAKEEELFNLLDNELLGQKIIFFTRFRKWVDRLELIMEKKNLNPLRITGAESAEKREENKLKFQSSPDHNIILITSAGGSALNLQAARVLIWGDLILSYGDVIQVIGRMIRFGSEHKKVLAIHLICDHTVDDHIFKIVFPKKKLFEAILGKRHEGLLEFTDVMESEVNGIYQALLGDAVAKKAKK